MKKIVKMLGRPVEIELSNSAEKHLENIDAQLCIEMELYFSCLLRKRVVIRETIDSDFSVIVSDKLKIGFRPVMTKSCSISSCNGDSPPLSDFPIVKPERYVPHWLKIDYRKGQWAGEFGYNDAKILESAVLSNVE
jgi:hypothetical protein